MMKMESPNHNYGFRILLNQLMTCLAGNTDIKRP